MPRSLRSPSTTSNRPTPRRCMTRAASGSGAPAVTVSAGALITSAEESSVTRRREVAALNDWEARYERMSLLIEQELRRKKAAARGASAARG